MPLYDYLCVVCGKQTEIFKPLSKLDDLELCCDSAMRRIINGLIPLCHFDMQRRASVKRVMKKKLEAERK